MRPKKKKKIEIDQWKMLSRHENRNGKRLTQANRIEEK